jgi:hypothetical protein
MRELASDYERDRDTLVARAQVIKGSPQLQLYQAEHQHGWEADVVAALERRSEAGPVLDHDELQLLTAVATAALRISLDVWIARKRGPGLPELLDGAFARLATGFEPVPR